MATNLSFSAISRCPTRPRKVKRIIAKILREILSLSLSLQIAFCTFLSVYSHWTLFCPLFFFFLFIFKHKVNNGTRVVACEYQCANKVRPRVRLSPADTFNEHSRNYVHAGDANVDPCPAACRAILPAAPPPHPSSRMYTCCSDIPGYHASLRVREIKVTS